MKYKFGHCRAWRCCCTLAISRHSTDLRFRQFVSKIPLLPMIFSKTFIDHMAFNKWNMMVYIKTETKWLTFCRGYFYIIFPVWKLLYFESNFTIIFIFLMVPIKNKQSLIKMMVWYLTDDKPFFKQWWPTLLMHILQHQSRVNLMPNQSRAFLMLLHFAEFACV